MSKKILILFWSYFGKDLNQKQPLVIGNVKVDPLEKNLIIKYFIIYAIKTWNIYIKTGSMVTSLSRSLTISEHADFKGDSNFPLFYTFNKIMKIFKFVTMIS